eukprot:CAMPEP_0113619734 /NCGR_PEP_ID=MMETSP0017_2-20120614/10033_1 /TAXON_ID=2856 /ORGANISM="Cylindrotheca closterium" /LENGTH=47 /DNA_ID=CAMNT_0000529339 /DNA_START=91 /DNA_END=231 /DNA_ORIENTATION=- /assembly_acc=CAM_ASM_000147
MVALRLTLSLVASDSAGLVLKAASHRFRRSVWSSLSMISVASTVFVI